MISQVKHLIGSRKIVSLLVLIGLGASAGLADAAQNRVAKRPVGVAQAKTTPAVTPITQKPSATKLTQSTLNPQPLPPRNWPPRDAASPPGAALNPARGLHFEIPPLPSVNGTVMPRINGDVLKR